VPTPDSPEPLSPRRAELASFAHAYAVAVQLASHCGREQCIVATGDPIQPYRTSAAPAANDEQVLARVA
jgi:hypothetical protein